MHEISKHMKRCALCYLFTFSFALLSAQDFLITTKGDSIKGTINFQLIGKIEIANIKASKREIVSAINTREVFLKGKRFKPVQFNGSILFMQILTEGYLSLLAFQPPNIMTYDGRLLQKKDGQLLEVPGIGFKKSMAKFFSDCPDLANKINAGEFGSKDLTEIINQYNILISKN